MATDDIATLATSDRRRRSRSTTGRSKKKTMKLTVVFLSLAVALAMGQNYYLQFSGSSKDVQPAFQHLNDVAPYYRLDEVPFHDVPIRFRLIRAV